MARTRRATAANSSRDRVGGHHEQEASFHPDRKSLRRRAGVCAERQRPYARPGHGDARRHLQQHGRARHREALRVPGPRQRCAVERRRPGPEQQDLVPGLRREFRPQRPVHVPARRHVRRVQGRGVPQRHPAHPLVERVLALRGERRQRADGDVPFAALPTNPPPRGTGIISGSATTGATPAATANGRRTVRGTSGSTATR